MKRKVAAWLTGTAAALPLAALSATPPAVSTPGAFSPPETQLVLTRVLHSPLADGKEVIARRSYAVRIMPDGDGFRVDGELLGCEVEAPPPLQALAEIERKRPDTGLFPMRLDRKGMLVASTTAAQPGEATGNAAAIASRAVEGSALDSAERAHAQGFIAQIRNKAARTLWPSDLFRPEPGRRVERQQFTLPDGGEGHITVEINARTESGPGVLTELERTVVTEMDGSRRVTREEWTIAHLK
ncbi:MAG: hypothetical protein ABWZ75_03435 [Novosphingobium sp.]